MILSFSLKPINGQQKLRTEAHRAMNFSKYEENLIKLTR
jgi:hypothetical protein